MAVSLGGNTGAGGKELLAGGLCRSRGGGQEKSGSSSNQHLVSSLLVFHQK